MPAAATWGGVAISNLRGGACPLGLVVVVLGVVPAQAKLRGLDGRPARAGTTSGSWPSLCSCTHKTGGRFPPADGDAATLTPTRARRSVPLRGQQTFSFTYSPALHGVRINRQPREMAMLWDGAVAAAAWPSTPPRKAQTSHSPTALRVALRRASGLWDWGRAPPSTIVAPL